MLWLLTIAIEEIDSRQHEEQPQKEQRNAHHHHRDENEAPLRHDVVRAELHRVGGDDDDQRSEENPKTPGHERFVQGMEVVTRLINVDVVIV